MLNRFCGLLVASHNQNRTALWPRPLLSGLLVLALLFGVTARARADAAGVSPSSGCAVCGDNICSGDENGCNCPSDHCPPIVCLPYFPNCGNGICELTAQPAESHERCPADCPDPCNPPLCGNGVIDAGEECDEGGTCIGGSNAGSACTAESQCVGNGVCIGGLHDAMSCTDDAACAGGTCRHCKTFGGNGCAANCTTETSIAFDLVPGEPKDDGTLIPHTSGVEVHGAPTLPNLALLLKGTQTLTIGKARGGQVPAVIKATSVRFDKIRVAPIGCACIRAVARKTCGGTLTGTDGSPSPDCTLDETACTGSAPCTFLHGAGNSATGTIGCSRLDGINVCASAGCNDQNQPCDFIIITQTADGSIVKRGGIGGPGSAVFLTSTEISQVTGACAPSFCTDAEPESMRGIPQTEPLVTGYGRATLCEPLPDQASELTVFGTPFSCGALAHGDTGGACLVGAAITSSSPHTSLTSVFCAQSAPTDTATPTWTSTITPTPEPTTPAPTASESWTPDASATPTSEPTAVVSETTTPVAAPTETPTDTIPATASPSPSAPADCVGDCSEDRVVTADDLLSGMATALGTLASGECVALDCSPPCGPGPVQQYVAPIACLLRAVNNAKSGCEPIHCESDQDCDDGNGCSTDTCTPAGCRHLCVCD